MVARSPAAPTTPFRTVSGAPSAAARSAATEMSSRMPASPACTASSGASAAARAAASASCRHTSRTPCATRLLDDPGGVTPGRQAHEAQLRHGRQHLERLAPDRARRAEDEQVSGGGVRSRAKGYHGRPQRRGSRPRTSSCCRTPVCAGWRTRARRAPEGTQGPRSRRRGRPTTCPAVSVRWTTRVGTSRCRR